MTAPCCSRRIIGAAWGFTLLEVILGMALVGVLMLLLFAGLRTGATSWHVAGDKLYEVSQRAAVLQFFTLRWRNVLPAFEPPGDQPQGDPQLSFQGQADTVRFISLMPASVRRGGMQRFTVSIEQRGVHKTIWVRMMPFYPTQPGQVWPEEEAELLEGVHDAKFQYYGPPDGRDGDWMWHSEWLNRDQLPKLIKISIEMANGERWPDITVAPRVSAVPGAADTISGFVNPFAEALRRHDRPMLQP